MIAVFPRLLVCFALGAAVRLSAQDNLPVDLPAAPRRALNPDTIQAGANAAGAVPETIRVSASTVTTIRSTATRPDAGTTVQLTFAGAPALNAARIADVRVLRAQDDQGARLTRAAGASTPPRYLSTTATQTPRSAALILRGISRAAEEIVILEGEVDIVPIGTQGNAMVVPDYLAQAGKPVAIPGLLENDVELIPLNQATFAAHTSEYSGPAITDFTNVAVFLVRDPQRALSSFAIEDETGRPIGMQSRTRGSRPDGTISFTYTLGAPMPARAALRVEMAAVDGIKTYRFRLDNIVLP